MDISLTDEQSRLLAPAPRPRRRLTRPAIALVLAGAAVLACAPAPTPAQSQAERSPVVFCVTQAGERTRGVHRYRPHNCVYLRQNTQAKPSTTVTTSRVHWERWGNRDALGRGRVLVRGSGYGRVKIRLTRKRRACGSWVFSRGTFVITARVNGQIRRVSGRMALENCRR